MDGISRAVDASSIPPHGGSAFPQQHVSLLQNYAEISNIGLGSCTDCRHDLGLGLRMGHTVEGSDIELQVNLRMPSYNKFCLSRRFQDLRKRCSQQIYISGSIEVLDYPRVIVSYMFKTCFIVCPFACQLHLF